MAFGAAPTYTGTTTISAGTLQIGNDHSVTSFASTATLDNATLAFKDTGASPTVDVISGSGGIVAEWQRRGDAQRDQHLQRQHPHQ